jgi:hypothetical protein
MAATAVISELFDLVSLSKKAAKESKLNPNDAKTVASVFQKAKSISSQASKYVLEYPTLCSSNITDYNTALAITKQVELDCAKFIILASGLNPFVRLDKNDTIEAHINNLMTSYESVSGLKVSITPADEEYVRAVENYMVDGSRPTQEYKHFKENVLSTEKYSFMSREWEEVNVNDEITDENAEASEPEAMTFDGEGGYKQIIEDIVNAYSSQPDSTLTSIVKPLSSYVDPSKAKDEKEYKKAEEYYKELMRERINSRSAGLQSDVLKKLGGHAPTIVTIKFNVVDGNGSNVVFDVPLAVKSSLIFVNAIDVADLVSKVKTPGSKLLNLIKLTTGQINFFKDLILGLDESRKDVDREKNLGHMPYFRQLMANKNRYKLKNIAETIKPLKGIIAKKSQKDLPMFTIIMTEEELTEAAGIRFSYMLKDRTKFIDYFLDTYMLLGLGVVDPENEVIYFFHAGEDGYDTVSIPAMIKNATGGSSSDQSSLIKALASMTKMIGSR